MAAACFIRASGGSHTASEMNGCAMAIIPQPDATRSNRHPPLNLPAKAICLHKGPASKAMLVWPRNY